MEERIIVETLHDAALRGDLEGCKLLLDSESNVNALNDNYLTRMICELP
jgi:hypothetical protein